MFTPLIIFISVGILLLMRQELVVQAPITLPVIGKRELVLWEMVLLQWELLLQLF
jgi:hypothetical protein